MPRIGLGVAGGIGAYKAVEVARLLQQRGHDVRAIMTRAAQEFIGPLTFEAITRQPVVTSQFAPGLNADIEHIAIASNIDLLLVAPATANVLGKFAGGIADDFLTGTFLATEAPVLVAPSMNVNMWAHPAVRANVETLASRGVRFVEPGEGYLACGWIGKGRLAEPADIVEAAERMLARRTTLEGRRVLVTAGPTVEDLDPVRFIGNRSSGRMGVAIAQEARDRGAEVVLVAGPMSVAPPSGVTVLRVRSAKEMHAAVMEHWSAMDAVVMAAAVADYTPVGGAAARKIEKTDEERTPVGDPRVALIVTLERTIDILADLGARRAGAARPMLVGFAAQTGDPLPAARRKLTAKRADLVVANDVSAEGSGFDVDTNQVTFVSHDDVEALPMMSKSGVASRLLDRVERVLASPPALPVTR